MKTFIVLFALIAVAYAGIATYGHGLHTGLLTTTGYQAPSLHAPWASSVDTGIRRFGSTAGIAVAAVPAYYTHAHLAAPAYHHYY